MEDGSILAVAYETVRNSQQKMLDKYKVLSTLYKDNEIQSLYKYAQNLFQHDEWVQREYSGGFNSHQMSEKNGVQQILEMTETSLQVSGQVAALLLERVRDQDGNEMKYGYGGNGYRVAPGYASSEQQIVFFASELIDYLKKTKDECKDAGLLAQSSSDIVLSNQLDNSRHEGALDADFIIKLEKFAQIVKEQPFAADARYY